MLVVLMLVGVPLFLWVYFLATRAARASDPEGVAVLAIARLWHHKYTLRPAWALSLARGSRILIQSLLCLAAAIPIGAASATNPGNESLWWAFIALLCAAFVLLPLLAVLVGYAGRPQSWLRSGSEAVSIEDI